MNAWQFKHGGDVPMHLGFYEPAILHACKHLSRTGRTLDDPVEATPTLLRLLDTLPPLVSAAEGHPVRQRAYQQAFDLLDTALREGAPEPDEDALLAKVRGSLRRQHGFAKNPKTKFGIDAVFSDEPLRYPEPEQQACAIDLPVGGDFVAGHDESDVVDQASCAAEHRDGDEHRTVEPVDCGDGCRITNLHVVDAEQRHRREVVGDHRGHGTGRSLAVDDGRRSSPQCREDRRRDGPMFGVEICVTAGHRQPIGLAHERTADHLGREFEIGGHAAHDGELLRVLATEVRTGRTDDREQLRHDGGDAVEMTRP